MKKAPQGSALLTYRVCKCAKATKRCSRGSSSCTRSVRVSRGVSGHLAERVQHVLGQVLSHSVNGFYATNIQRGRLVCERSAVRAAWSAGSARDWVPEVLLEPLEQAVQTLKNLSPVPEKMEWGLVENFI